MSNFSRLFRCAYLLSLFSLTGCMSSALQATGVSSQTLLRYQANPLSKNGQLTLILKVKSTQHPILASLPQKEAGYINLDTLPFNIQSNRQNTMIEGTIQDSQITVPLSQSPEALTLQIQLPNQQLLFTPLNTLLKALPANAESVVVTFEDITIQSCEENCITLQNRDNTININGSGNVCFNGIHSPSPVQKADQALMSMPMKS